MVNKTFAGLAIVFALVVVFIIYRRWGRSIASGASALGRDAEGLLHDAESLLSPGAKGAAAGGAAPASAPAAPAASAVDLPVTHQTRRGPSSMGEVLAAVAAAAAPQPKSALHALAQPTPSERSDLESAVASAPDAATLLQLLASNHRIAQRIAATTANAASNKGIVNAPLTDAERAQQLEMQTELPLSHQGSRANAPPANRMDALMRTIGEKHAAKIRQGAAVQDRQARAPMGGPDEQLKRAIMAEITNLSPAAQAKVRALIAPSATRLDAPLAESLHKSQGLATTTVQMTRGGASVHGDIGNMEMFYRKAMGPRCESKASQAARAVSAGHVSACGNHTHQQYEASRGRGRA